MAHFSGHGVLKGNLVSFISRNRLKFTSIYDRHKIM